MSDLGLDGGIPSTLVFPFRFVPNFRILEANMKREKTELRPATGDRIGAVSALDRTMCLEMCRLKPGPLLPSFLLLAEIFAKEAEPITKWSVVDGFDRTKPAR